MATKPTIADARWATDGAAELTAPSSGQRDSGFVGGTAAVADYANVLHKEAYKWAQYLDEGALSGALSLVSDISPAALAADQNDWNPTSLSTSQVIRASASTTGIDLTGLAGGADGRLLMLFNVGATYSLTLKDENASSTAANRFALGKDLELPPSGCALLLYDATSSRWRVAASHCPARSITRRINPRAGLALDSSTPITTNQIISAAGATFQFYPANATHTLQVPIPDMAEDEYLEGVSVRVRANPDNGTDDMTLKLWCSADSTGTQLGSTQTSAVNNAWTTLTISGLTEEPSANADASYVAVIGFTGSWGGTGAGNIGTITYTVRKRTVD
jgi:hypothetical protein